MGLEVSIGGKPSDLWPYQEIRRTQGFTPGEQVRFERGEQAGREYSRMIDQGILTAIHSVAPLLESRVDRPDHRKRQFRLAALGLLLVMPIAVAAYHYGMPAAVEWIALKVPVSWERRLGRSVVSTLAPENIRVSDRACTEPVNRILEMLTSRLPETPYTFHVTLVESENGERLRRAGWTSCRVHRADQLGGDAGGTGGCARSRDPTR